MYDGKLAQSYCKLVETICFEGIVSLLFETWAKYSIVYFERQFEEDVYLDFYIFLVVLGSIGVFVFPEIDDCKMSK